MSGSVGGAISRTDARFSGFAPPSNTSRPRAPAPRAPLIVSPVMSSPATVTDAIANSRSIFCAGGGAVDPGSPISAIAWVAALMIAASDCTWTKYSPGATPLSVKLPSLSVLRCAAGHEHEIERLLHRRHQHHHRAAHRLAVGAHRVTRDSRQPHRQHLDVGARDAPGRPSGKSAAPRRDSASRDSRWRHSPSCCWIPLARRRRRRACP